MYVCMYVCRWCLPRGSPTWEFCLISRIRVRHQYSCKDGHIKNTSDQLGLGTCLASSGDMASYICSRSTPIQSKSTERGFFAPE